ncbi:MAG: N-formylglutamate amidohydrolase [Rubripirellula sp.]
MRVLISCEVGGADVPDRFIAKKWRDSLSAAPMPSVGQRKKSLRAGSLPPRLSCDEGAKHFVAALSRPLNATVVANSFSPELIEVSRSPHHQQLFPPATRKWSVADRKHLIDVVYDPYRMKLRETLRGMLIQSTRVLHLSVRTFPLKSPGKKKTLRRADMGLLYDPACDSEVDFCLDWIDDMYDEVPMLRVRRNYPRRGTHDCITKAMRTEFGGVGYLGVEVLLNQAWAGRQVAIRDEVIAGICWSLQGLLGEVESAAA